MFMFEFHLLVPQCKGCDFRNLNAGNTESCFLKQKVKVHNVRGKEKQVFSEFVES